MTLTQKMKDDCRNSRRIPFASMQPRKQDLLAEALLLGVLQYWLCPFENRKGYWCDCYHYGMCRSSLRGEVAYRIDPDAPTASEKEPMKITAKELAECQNAEKRVYNDLPRTTKILIALAALNNRLQILDCDNRWRDSDTDILFDGYIYRICPTTPVIEDKKPEFVDYPIFDDGRRFYFNTVGNYANEYPVDTAPSFVKFRCFVYESKSGLDYLSTYLCPQPGTLKAVRFRNT